MTKKELRDNLTEMLKDNTIHDILSELEDMYTDSIDIFECFNEDELVGQAKRNAAILKTAREQVAY